MIKVNWRVIMIMTSDWALVLDEVEQLNKMILSSEPLKALQQAHAAVYSDSELVSKIQAFTKTKELYEDVQRFGKYHPDYHQVMKTIRIQKRELDLDERIAKLKLAENDYQDLLDEISVIIAQTISPSVKVPVSNPFFASSSSGCSTGGCGTGGGCSCSA